VFDRAREADEDVIEVGLTGADGTADLVGYAWTGAVADSYWLVLDPSSVNRPPGLRGQFAEGLAVPYPAGQAPCPQEPLRSQPVAGLAAQGAQHVVAALEQQPP
jgi:hypothetical protein